jgi:hypothetical protein
MATRPASSTSSSRQSPKSSPPSGRARSGAKKTPERDEHYDLISVLYHALQGGDTIGQYVQDASEAQDKELVAFLEDTQTVYAQVATRAKQLLAARIEAAGGEGSEDEDEEEEEEEEDDDED